VDLLFVPETAEVYPEPQTITVHPGEMGSEWEGPVRPGHFTGVLTVVAKLFNMVSPDVAVFGQKDMQQAALVRAMVRQMNLPIEVVVNPTVREPDGLAMSSRNAYLSAAERSRAADINRALVTAGQAFTENVRDAAALERRARDVLERDGAFTIDYLAVVDPETFRRVDTAVRGSAMIVAARLGGTRLIDNLVV
jgi:pantoate--beta-alanine ligase